MTPIQPGTDDEAAQEAPAAQDEPNNTNGHHSGDVEDVLAPPRPPATEISSPTPGETPGIITPPPGVETPSPDRRTEDPPGGPPEAPPSSPDDAAAPADDDRRRRLDELLAILRESATSGELEEMIARRQAGGELVLRESVEVNREIDCEIYAVRGGRLAGSPAPRLYLTLTLDAVRHSRLSGLLLANLKGSVKITVHEIQAPLEDDDEKDLPDPGVQRELPLRNTPEAIIAGRDEAHRAAWSVDNVGNVYRPHSYAPDPTDAQKCALCGAGEGHDLHEGKKRQTARTALRRRSELLLPHPYTPGALDGPAGPEACVYCSLEEADGIHARGQEELPTFADRVIYWRDVEGLDEAVAYARARAETEAGEAGFMTEADELAEKLIRDAQGDAGDVDASLEAPVRDEDLTDEQREARRRLADGTSSSPAADDDGEAL